MSNCNRFEIPIGREGPSEIVELQPHLYTMQDSAIDNLNQLEDMNIGDDYLRMPDSFNYHQS